MSGADTQDPFLALMGVDEYVLRQVGSRTPEQEQPAALPIPVPDSWLDLVKTVSTCTRCSLHETRTQTVFGVGNPDADWLFVGEAPGEQEDLRGEPFVGRAGQLLDEMIRALGLSREAVYIANILKCRPPKNRDPSPAESLACEPFLVQQVQNVGPKIIVAVGRIAAQNLLKTQQPMSELRGKVHQYEGIPVIVTYHPAYLLRKQSEKRRAWVDLKLARNTLNHSI